MNSAALLVATALVGVDYGWRPDDDGQLEYLVQLEPALVRSMEQGTEVISELPPEVRDVRRFRISIGSAALPRENLPRRFAPRAEIPAAAIEPIEKGVGERKAARPTSDRAPTYLRDLDGDVAASQAPPRASSPSDEKTTSDPEPKKPAEDPESGNLMTWLIGAIVALCASLGGNLYQSWNLASARRRYYQLVDRLGLRGPTDDGVTIVET